MVIHQEKNTKTEHVAKAYARQLFEQQGYRITKGKRGCDFIARKRDQVIPVEVKGRSNLMNFTNMSRYELKTLQQTPNARVVLVYVDVKGEPQALGQVTLTKDDVAEIQVSTYRVKWKVPLEERITEDLRKQIDQNRLLIKQYEEGKDNSSKLVGT